MPPTSSRSTGTSTLPLDPILEPGSGEGVGLEYEIYTQRFNENEDTTRAITWRILCKKFFQQFIRPNDTVVDVGAGDGNFILNIKAKKRIAVDLSRHALDLQAYGVEVLQVSAGELSNHLDCAVDVVFMSNFLEHLPDKRTLLAVFAECHKILRPGGRLLILQPNIRYTGAAYWDYIDHHIALTEHSLCEALKISGFKAEHVIPRFLPYTVRSTVGKVASGRFTAFLVNVYLKLPFLWRIFGQQTFIAAARV